MPVDPYEQNINPEEMAAMGQPPAPVDPMADIDDDELTKDLFKMLQNDKRDKEDYGWVAKRQYDEEIYNCFRPPTNDPWPNACNYCVPLVRTLIDTAHSNVMASIFDDPDNTVDVQGQGQEDERTAKPLASLLNWQVAHEVDGYNATDKVVFNAFHDGTGVMKIVQDAYSGSVKWIPIPAENIFLPIDAKGFQVNQSSHVVEVVPLDNNDFEERMNLTDENGEPFYDGLKDVPKGFKIQDSQAIEILTRVRDSIFGTNKGDRDLRDYRYICEIYKTCYYKPKNQVEDFPKKRIELVIWYAPAIGKILRKRENKGLEYQDPKTGEIRRIVKRPYAKCIPYPRKDRIWGQSLGERVRPTQDELNYVHNQNINAADIAIRPYLFYREGSSFNPEECKPSPGAMFPVPEPKDVNVVRVTVDPIFERQEDRYWDLAERDTGLTELFQGRQQEQARTLGEASIRLNKSEIRFRDIYLRFEEFWKEAIELTYYYDRIYMPEDKKVKIIGTADYKAIKELFPKGLEGIYNFGFSSAPLTEKAERKQDKIQLGTWLKSDPLVMQNPGDNWRINKYVAEALNEKNLETLVSKPPEANVMSVEEAIQRIVSGQEVIPDPQIDAARYMMGIQMFTKTATFMELDEEAKTMLIQLFQRVQGIWQGQIKAQHDAMVLQQGMAMRQQAEVEAQKAQNRQKPAMAGAGNGPNAGR